MRTVRFIADMKLRACSGVYRKHFGVKLRVIHNKMLGNLPSA